MTRAEIRSDWAGLYAALFWRTHQPVPVGPWTRRLMDRARQQMLQLAWKYARVRSRRFRRWARRHSALRPLEEKRAM